MRTPATAATHSHILHLGWAGLGWAGLGWLPGLAAAPDHGAWLDWAGRLIILFLDQKESATEMRTHLMALFDTVERTL